MDTQDRIIIITDIARKDVNIGKTAMMKFLYLLQTVHNVPLEYDFNIYTYGPYSQSVMSDIEFADFIGYINVSPINYPNGMNGYQINATEDGCKIADASSSLLSQYGSYIDNIVSFFSNKSAKELELCSTVVFVFRSFLDSGWGNNKDEICNAVSQIKPHFTLDVISTAFDDLNSHDFLIA